MNDPAVEATKRAVPWRERRGVDVTIAREALKPIRELFDRWTAEDMPLPYTKRYKMLDQLAPLIFTSEELEP